eukprot:3563922-Pyramimonas_sp.AAC.1
MLVRHCCGALPGAPDYVRDAWEQHNERGGRGQDRGERTPKAVGRGRAPSSALGHQAPRERLGSSGAGPLGQNGEGKDEKEDEGEQDK